MKRCSQCEFTFEDPQQFCDFDDTELTVVPEPFPSFKKVSVPATMLPSPFVRVARSRVSVAVLALAGVMLSALLIGYFEAASQPNIAIASNAESGNELIPIPQGLSVPSDQAEVKPQEAVKSRFVSTQRMIDADEKSVASSKKKSPSTSKPEGTERRFEKANRQSLARSQKIGFQKTNQKMVPQKANSEFVAQNQKRPDYSKSQRRDSKFVAILKKTGRILKRPF